MDEEDRAAILRRRALLVASAIAGFTAVGCHDDSGASPTENGRSATAERSVPQPCLTAAVTAPNPPVVDTTTTADAGTEDAGTQAGSASASASAKPKPPLPTPCLSRPPPLPCLSPPVKR